MKNKTVTITLIALLTLSTFGLLFTTFLTPAAASPVDLSTAGPYAMGATPDMLGEKEIAMREYAAEVGAAVATQASPMGDPATIGEELNVTVSDMGAGIDYDETFVVVMDGTHGIILIEKAAYDNYDFGTDEYVFPNPNLCWRDEDRISTAQLVYLLDEFDNNIYPTDTEIFGEPLPRGDEGQKVWVLIHNIRDESYYDCDMTWYVAGYFSSSEDAEANKNMMHIDSYDWEHRTGDNPYRPYLYESVFAHEFQHLIHFDQDPDEPSWVDEACAEMAMYMCGYGHPSSHIMYYMAYHPMTSLTFWGGQLEDYGASYLFALYLYEHYGAAEFFTRLVQEQANGIEGIQKTLDSFEEYDITFDELYDDWTIANYLDDTSENPLYGYELIGIGTLDTRYWTIDYAVEYWDSHPYIGLKPINSDWFYGIEPLPYTAHYFHIRNRMPATIVLDGDDFSGTLAHSGIYEWYSGAEAWCWRSFSQSFAIPAEGITTLNFWTWYDIELDWDYGYVEVFDGAEWYTLADLNGLTVTTDPFGQDNPNVPIGREPRDYVAAERWNAFTGYSGGWVEVSMDLTQFAGETIDLYFRLWQDGAFTLQNMYIDDIEITNGVFTLDDVETGSDGWTADGWFITNGMNDNNFGVILLEKVNSYLQVDDIRFMDVDPDTETGIMFVEPISKKSGFIQVAIVTNHADHIIATHYDFRLYGGYQWFR